MKIAKVIIQVPLNTTFDYLVNDNLINNLAVGYFVLVEFRKTKLIGVVSDICELDEKTIKYKLKPLIKIIDLKPLNQQNLDFIKWVSDYNLIPIGMVLKFMFSENIFNIKEKEINKYYV